MQSETEHFLNFLEVIEDQEVVNKNDIANAFKHMDGLKGVVSDRFFISGYENLAWVICEKLSLERLKEFAKHNADLLTQDSASRYYFVQALMEKPELNARERRELLLCMPEEYHHFLSQRFLNECERLQADDEAAE